MKSTVPPVPARTLIVPDPSDASGDIALFARVWFTEKLIVLVDGACTASPGYSVRCPGPTGPVTARFTEMAFAVAGMPHGDAATSNVRVAPGCSDGPPSGPVGFLVSRTRHGDNV